MIYIDVSQEIVFFVKRRISEQRRKRESDLSIEVSQEYYFEEKNE